MKHLPTLLMLLLALSPAIAEAQSSPPTSAQSPTVSTQAEPTLAEILAAAVLAMAEDDLETAEALFLAASENAPDDPRPWLGNSRIAEQRGDLMTALEHVRQAYRVAPEVADVGLELGRLLTRLGTVSEALEVFSQVRQLDPSRSEAYLLPALILRQVGNNEGAVEILESARQTAANAPRLDEELGLRYLALGQHERALKLGEEIIATHGPRPLAHLVTGLALAGVSERGQQARHHLEQAIALGVPDPGRAHLELGILLLAADQPQEALAHLQEAGNTMPEAPEVHYRLAAAHRAVGDDAASRQSLQRFQELSTQRDSEDWQGKELGVSLNAIQALAANNQLDQAITQLGHLLEQDPTAHQAHALLAKIQFSSGRAEDASASILQARQLAPREVEYHFLEGYFAAHRQLPKQAQEALQRALALDDELPEAHALAAVLEADAEHFEQAAHHFARSLELGLDNVDLRRRYAAVLETLGRHKESEQQLQAARAAEATEPG